MKKLNEMWCCNRNLILGVGAISLVILFLFPNPLTAALPVLLVLACPLSCVAAAVLMGKGMLGQSAPRSTISADMRDERARG